MNFKKFKELVLHELSSLRDSAQKRKIASQSNPRSVYIPGYEFQNAPNFESKVQIQDLLALHDHVFITSCYMAILRRPPDENGMNYYLGRLRSGKFDKFMIISRLYFSREARRVKASLEGNKFPLYFSILKQIPVLGYFVKWLSLLFSLPAVQRQIFENHAHSISMQVHLQHYLRVAFAITTEEIVNVHKGQHDIVSDQQKENEKVKSFINDQKYINEQQSELASKQKSISKQLVELNELLDLLKIMQNELVKDCEALKECQEKIASSHRLSDSRYEKIEKEQKRILKELDSFLKEQQGLVVQVEENESLLQSKSLELDVAIQKSRAQLVKRIKVIRRNMKSLENLMIEYSKKEADVESSVIPSAFYASFEQRFRGKEEIITERLKVYVPFIDDLKSLESNIAIDLACGRGEWLSILNDNGFHAVGVDLNEVTNSHCRSIGLEVHDTDILEYLRSLPDNHACLISGFHIIEHIPFEKLFVLIQEVHRVLTPNGKIIFETPNPNNIIVGSNTFYMDPTHLSPLPPPLIEFCFQYQGFDTEVLALHPHPKRGCFKDFEGAELLNDLLFGSQDYAILGIKK